MEKTQIIKDIRITSDNRIMVDQADTTESPRTYRTEEEPRLTSILREQGRDGVSAAILEGFLRRDYRGTRKFDRAIELVLMKRSLGREQALERCENARFRNNLYEQFRKRINTKPVKRECYFSFAGCPVRTISGEHTCLSYNDFKRFTTVEDALLWLRSHTDRSEHYTLNIRNCKGGWYAWNFAQAVRQVA